MDQITSVFKGRLTKALLGLSLLSGFASVGFGQMFNITTLPGYEVVTTSTLSFNNAGGEAGWSVANGKVILGAKIISGGDTVSDFSVFRPTSPGETWNNYTLGANEYGFAFKAVTGASNPDVKFELYYADLMPGYTITKSGNLGYSATGVGGWSAPIPQVVSGGGFQFANSGASASVSQIVLENGNVAGYQYGPNEQGWTVQSAQVGGSANIYVISFDPAVIPEPSTYAAIFGLLTLGVVQFRRFRQKSVA